jgi:hypothetical protein
MVACLFLLNGCDEKREAQKKAADEAVHSGFDLSSAVPITDLGFVPLISKDLIQKAEQGDAAAQDAYGHAFIDGNGATNEPPRVFQRPLRLSQAGMADSGCC